jgi:hypothetical protein
MIRSVTIPNTSSFSVYSTISLLSFRFGVMGCTVVVVLVEVKKEGKRESRRV